jgi:hypothetical protein
VIRGEDPRVFIADDEDLMARVLALEVVADTNPRSHSDSSMDVLRELLLNEEWVEAISTWMSITNEIIDVYPDEPIWTRPDLSDEQATFEIRLAPIFRDAPGV